MFRSGLALAAVCAAVVTIGAVEGPYRVAGSARLGYFANSNVYDAASGRLYSSSRDGMFTVDAARGRVLSRVGGVPVGAVAVDPARAEAYVLARNTAQLTVVDATARKVARRFVAPAGYNVVFDGARNELYYMRGDATVAYVAERERGEHLATIPLAGHPSFVLPDPGRHRILVRLSDADLIQVIDCGTRRIAVSWVFPADGPSAMAIDAASSRLFATAKRSVKMLDGLSGKELGSFPTGDQATSIAFDPDTKLVAALWGGSQVNIARLDLLNITPVQQLDIRMPMRQLFLDPRTHAILGVGLIVDDNAFSSSSALSPRSSSVVTIRYRPAQPPAVF